MVWLPTSIVFGPISIAIALILPRKKLCPHCFKAIRKEKMVCDHCGKPMPIRPINPAEETTYANPQGGFQKKFELRWHAAP
jgi:predicted amidophosphoribosyltransferase